MITTVRAGPAELLHWYDKHHRKMPWRVDPADRRTGVRPDPYRVWLSEVMLQQTTVAAVTEYFLKFTTAWPDVHALAAAPAEDVLAAWAGLGYYARARNLIKCAGVVSRDLGGDFPDTEDGLRQLPGIGPYTAAAIAAIAFDRPATVVDGNVERVMARLFAEQAELPGVKDTLKAHAATLTRPEQPGDYAQAVMDLGATICTPRNPACGICPWRPACHGRAQGIAETLPRKAPKVGKPVRLGIAWVLLNQDQEVMTVRRPEKGLLGGMLAVPSSAWAETPPTATPPVPADWQVVGEIRHTFTHFHLRLSVQIARTNQRGGDFLPIDQALKAMPTVFAKVCRMVTADHLRS